MVITPARRRVVAILGGAWIVFVLGLVLASNSPGLIKLAFAVYLPIALISCALWGLGLSRWDRPLAFWRVATSSLAFLLVLLEVIVDLR